MWFQVHTDRRSFYVEADSLPAAERAADLLLIDGESLIATVRPIAEFETVAQAEAHFWEKLGDEDYIDNVRVGFEDDAASMAAYEAALASGCCGSYDLTMIAGGRFMAMGCNYGH